MNSLAITDGWRAERIFLEISSAASWRVGVDLRGLGNRAFDALRLMLVADVLSRAISELYGAQSQLVVVSGTDLSLAGLGNAALWIREPMMIIDSAVDLRALGGGSADVAVVSAVTGPADASGNTAAPRCTVCVAPVVTRDLAVDVADILQRWDPLAFRLVLLRSVYARPCVLTAARLRRATATLDRWRFKVAGWADVSSVPASQDGTDELRRAIGADIDTARALRSMHRLEVDSTTSSRAKFDTFAFIDRVLGLDLCRLVGKLRA